MNENILSAFKNELGYVNATNQYVEQKRSWFRYKKRFARIGPKCKFECIYSLRRLYVQNQQELYCEHTFLF